MEFKLSDFCLKVVSVPDAGIYFFIKNLGEVLVPCDFMPRKKDCRSGYKCVFVLYITRERERERKRVRQNFFVFIYHAGINSFVFTAMHNFILHPGKAFAKSYRIQSEKSSLSSLPRVIFKSFRITRITCF